MRLLLILCAIAVVLALAAGIALGLWWQGRPEPPAVAAPSAPVVTGGIAVPATVLRIADGDTLTVRLDQGVEERVRLLYIDTPEYRTSSRGPAIAEVRPATAFIRSLLPIGEAVVLHGPGRTLERDRYGRLLAVVLIPGARDPGLSVQERIVRAGWSAYVTQYGRAPDPLDGRLRSAQGEAEREKAGIWGTNPEWIRRRADAPGR